MLFEWLEIGPFYSSLLFHIVNGTYKANRSYTGTHKLFRHIMVYSGNYLMHPLRHYTIFNAMKPPYIIRMCRRVFSIKNCINYFDILCIGPLRNIEYIIDYAWKCICSSVILLLLFSYSIFVLFVIRTLFKDDIQSY